MLPAAAAGQPQVNGTVQKMLGLRFRVCQRCSRGKCLWRQLPIVTTLPMRFHKLQNGRGSVASQAVTHTHTAVLMRKIPARTLGCPNCSALSHVKSYMLRVGVWGVGTGKMSAGTSSKRRRRVRSASPANFPKQSAPLRANRVTGVELWLQAPARARATRVLPVPGAPWNRMPLQ